MPYDSIKIGKIRNIDYKTGVGEIITNDNNYLFTTDCISSNEKLATGDVVKFRAELIHDTPKAYFIDKVDLEKGVEGYQVLKSKRYNN